jgi:hypothetical protein
MHLCLAELAFGLAGNGNPLPSEGNGRLGVAVAADKAFTEGSAETASFRARTINYAGLHRKTIPSDRAAITLRSRLQQRLSFGHLVHEPERPAIFRPRYLDQRRVPQGSGLLR